MQMGKAFGKSSQIQEVGTEMGATSSAVLQQAAAASTAQG